MASEGHQFDLEDLAQLLATGDVRVAHDADEDAYYLSLKPWIGLFVRPADVGGGGWAGRPGDGQARAAGLLSSLSTSRGLRSGLGWRMDRDLQGHAARGCRVG